MSKVRTCTDGKIVFWCPGCDSTHGLNVKPASPRPCWTYNGNPAAPTFSPSILVTCDWPLDDDTPASRDVCHSFVRDGRIQFLGDSTHALAGRTVDLPDWPYAPGTYGGIQE